MLQGIAKLMVVPANGASSRAGGLFRRGVFGLIFTCLLLNGCVHAPSAVRLEEASYLTVGGIQQWVTIRGDDQRNPILLFVHGGPGDPQSPLVTTYAPYESHFVLVQWDQRGAGRTYARLGEDTPNLALDTLIADGIELASILRRRFPHNRLVLVGHSFGSLVAVGMAQQRPDLFDAYVGVGQVSRWTDTVQFQFDYLSDVARRTGDTSLESELASIGRPDPTNVGQYFAFTRPLRRLMSEHDVAWLSGLRDLVMTQPGFTSTDFDAVVAGMEFSGPRLVDAMFHTDLFQTAPALDLPVYLIQGREDVSTPTPLAQAWFDAVRAPHKEMVIIEDAGHFAIATHQGQVIAALRRMLEEEHLGARHD